jgi:hypothetical protein
MENLPIYITLIFGLTTILTIYLFYMSTKHSKITLLILFIWVSLQGIVGFSGFYKDTSTVPPKFLLLALPPLAFILGLFLTKTGRKFIDSLSLKNLTMLHIVRIPVEIVLFWLYINKTIPQLMTFEGRNFDITAGITAPIIYYFCYVEHRIKGKMILLWNIICLALLVNIIINAVLSLPFPFQEFGFEQPNIAVLYFPFVWLPSCVVPLVLLSHLASIRQLLNRRAKNRH